MLRKRKIIEASITRAAHQHNITSNRDSLSSSIINGNGKVVLLLTEENFWEFCDRVGDAFASAGEDAESVEVKISVP